MITMRIYVGMDVTKSVVLANMAEADLKPCKSWLSKVWADSSALPYSHENQLTYDFGGGML